MTIPPALSLNLRIVAACVCFLFIASSLAAEGSIMFADTDPLWHVAAGDLIRANHAIPLSDPWSFTAGDYRWLNISWAWDAGMSWVVEHWGWPGAIAINACIVALVLALALAMCLWAGGDLIISPLVVLGIVLAMPTHLRPLQVTHLMTAIWLWTLMAHARGRLSHRWLAALPPLMVVWVNMHGGFVVGGILLLAFFAQACVERDLTRARALFLAGLASLLAMLANPYGLGIVEAVWRPLSTSANHFIIEWKTFTATLPELQRNMLAVAFLLLVPGRKLPILGCERWLAYFWLFMGLQSMRHMPVFAIVAAPIMAVALYQWLPHRPVAPRAKPVVDALIFAYDRRVAAAAALAACLLSVLWLPPERSDVTLPDLRQEIAYIDAHIAKPRLITHFNIASILAYDTRGRIPVFIDPRTETAFPADVMKDYVDFEDAAPGWEAILDRHAINGIMLPVRNADSLHARFKERRGWKTAFTSDKAVIYLRCKDRCN